MKPLSSLAELDICLIESMTRPVLIFKHSTACPISSEAYRQVMKYAEAAADTDPEVYIVKVIEDRFVSNQIAEVLATQHKSPQILLVKNRAVAWTSSHYGINAQSIQDAISSH